MKITVIDYDEKHFHMKEAFDNYYITLEKYEENLDLFEEELLSNPGRKTSYKFHRIRNELIVLREWIIWHSKP